jgi:ketosteroid isomerase-like protein
MKRLLGGLLVMIFAAVIANAQSGKVEQEILKLEQQWQDALVKGDAAALEKLYHDGLIYTHSNASTDNKTTYIAKIKSKATKYHSIKRDDIKVSIYGNTAIVTCHWLVHAEAGGNQIHTDARFLHVYLKQKGGWQMVAHQSTLVAK